MSFIEDTSLSGDAYRVEAKDSAISVFGNTSVSFNGAVGYLVRHQNGGLPSDESDEIYVHAEKAYYFVSPLTKESILANRGEDM